MVEPEVEYWDRRSSRYASIYTMKTQGLERLFDRFVRKAFRERVKQTFDYLGNIEGKKLLDVGCGTGIYLLEALRRGAREVTGLDISGKMLGAADLFLKANFSEACKWRLVKQHFEDFKYREKYHVVLIIGLLEYLKNPKRGFAALKGCDFDVLVCTFSKKFSLYSMARKLLLKIKGLNLTLFSRQDIYNICHNNDLTIRCFRTIGPTYWVVMEPVRVCNV